MTPEAFALLVASCSLSLPPGITTDRLRAYAQVESSLNPNAAGPVNRNGTTDYGLMGLNSSWIGRPGFPATVAEAMQPCANLAAGIRILADADRRASCYYNSNGRACGNGYVERIQAAAARQATLPPVPVAPAPPAAPPHAWDVWAMPAPEPAPPPPAVEVEAEKPRVIVELQTGD